jgi:deoxyadenosine/deoxycytidine kinase
MIVAFDGNVFSGKTSIIKELSSLCNSVYIDEQGAFMKTRVSNHGVSSRDQAISLQLKYLIAEEERCAYIQDDKVNLLDRSFVSMAAHVFALHNIHSIDIREWFLQEIQRRMESGLVIIPDVFCFVRCGHDVISRRIAENKSKDTDCVYYSDKYLCAIDGFNNKWIAKSGGTAVDTDSVFPIGLAQKLKGLVNVPGKRKLNTQQICDYLRDILLR